MPDSGACATPRRSPSRPVRKVLARQQRRRAAHQQNYSYGSGAGTFYLPTPCAYTYAC